MLNCNEHTVSSTSSLRFEDILTNATRRFTVLSVYRTQVPVARRVPTTFDVVRLYSQFGLQQAKTELPSSEASNLLDSHHPCYGHSEQARVITAYGDSYDYASLSSRDS